MRKSKKDTNELEGLESTEDDYKIDKVAKKYVLIQHWEKTLNDNLKLHYRELTQFIKHYRDKNIHKLDTPYPIDYPAWPKNICEKILYKFTGIDEEKFVEDVMTIRGWEGYMDTYLEDKAPFILMMLIARWLLLNNHKLDYDIFCHYIGYGIYWGVFTTIFRRYKPNPEVMRYTIAELSYKSRLKSLGSVDRWLGEGVQDTLKSYDTRLRRASDFELHYIQEKIRGKFKSAMKSIFRAQEKNEAAGNKIFDSKSQLELGDEETIQVENESQMTKAVGIAEKYTNKFYKHPIDERIVKSVMIPNGISERDLKRTLELIADNKDSYQDVRRLYQSLLFCFLEDGKNDERDIGTIKFYVEMKKMYKPGNTNDPNKLFIKEVLDRWLAEGSKTFRTTNRTATITTFRQCIYNYFVMKIIFDK